MLPVIAQLIDEELADTRELYATLSDARSKPHVLDDQTVQRVQRVYGEKWERAEVDRVAGELVPLRAVIEMTLELADELKHGTIDAIMRTSDLQLGLETLLGLTPTIALGPCRDRVSDAQQRHASRHHEQRFNRIVSDFLGRPGGDERRGANLAEIPFQRPPKEELGLRLQGS
ncbi:MAG: hypothetical protein ACLP50_22915 [Solirubrobacteraceae bacterium]